MRQNDNKTIDREYYRVPIDMTNSECQEFHDLMQKYKKEKILSSGVSVTLYDERQFLIDNNALASDGAVVVKGYRRLDDGSIDCKQILFETLSLKLEQWGNWLGRKEFAQKKLLENMDDLAIQTQAVGRVMGYGYKDDPDHDDPNVLNTPD